MPDLIYALNASGKLVHVNTVPNGLKCACRCPSCGTQLVAKNNGETISAHFAHITGVQCANAHESELHLLAKEIIGEEKSIMLPRYGNIYQGGLIRFDSVEIEQRNDISSLQPDICGVAKNSRTGKDSRLWIEIRVTHPIGPEKRLIILQNNISCLEIDLSNFINQPITKDTLKSFLIESYNCREWTNNPILEHKRMESLLAKCSFAQRKNEELLNKRLSFMDAYDVKEELEQEEKTYLKEHNDTCIVNGKGCLKCKHHTTRHVIFEEIKHRHFPVWLKEALSSNLLYWTKDDVHEVVFFDKCYKIQYNTYIHLLPTESPDVLGRPVNNREIRQNKAIIPFLIKTVPSIIASEGIKCHHCIHTFNTFSTNYDIACNIPNVVHKHRKKK